MWFFATLPCAEPIHMHSVTADASGSATIIGRPQTHPDRLDLVDENADFVRQGEKTTQLFPWLNLFVKPFCWFFERRNHE